MGFALDVNWISVVIITTAIVSMWWHSSNRISRRGVFTTPTGTMKHNAGPTVETLCHKCADDYEEAGFIVIKVPGQKFKDSCTHCQRGQGWDYEVKDRDRARD